MNKKLLEALQDKCKDFGLSKKAIEDLAEIGSQGLSDDTSDEDIVKKADSLVPFAKQMQAEVTRKAQKPSHTKTEGTDGNDGNGGNKGGDETEPAWFTKYKAENDKRVDALVKENETLKAEKLKTERGALIKSTAKELDIPEFLVQHLSLADDADIKQVLTNYKQELINNKLMPADSASVTSSSAEAVKDDAKAWANSLPNN